MRFGSIRSAFDEGYRPETSYIFLLCGIGIFLVLFYIYPIVPRAPAFLHSFPVINECCKGFRPGISYIFLFPGARIFLVLFYIYPIVPHASAFCAQLFSVICSFYIAENINIL